MDKAKISPQETYEVLEQQKQLQDVRAMIIKVLVEVQEFNNALTIENLELANSQIDTIDDPMDPQNPNFVDDPAAQERRAAEINQQIIDLELNMAADYDDDSVESDL